MATRPARTADEIAETIKSLVDRMLEADVTKEIGTRGQQVAGVVADRASDAAHRAQDAWRDSQPVRRDVARNAEKTWQKRLRPMLRDLWGRRAVALGAAGAAVPAGRELADSAAVRMGLKRREERHWGAFFLGMLVGAALGAIVAMLTTPKPGRQIRSEIGTRAGEISHRAEEWVPLFQREGESSAEPTSGEQAAADTARAERAADEAASGIQESVELPAQEAPEER